MRDKLEKKLEENLKDEISYIINRDYGGNSNFAYLTTKDIMYHVHKYVRDKLKKKKDNKKYSYELEKAIELLKGERDYHFDANELEYAKEIEEVIFLFKKLRKYKLAIEELENILLPEQWKVVELFLQKYLKGEK